MATDRRYQVFVSSTYQDLEEERREIIQALLELDCIPSGMELFPAANDDQWTLIKRVIDDCDYYLVVVAGRYGSVSTDGISYTEMEYRYALERAKPIVGFLHKNPDQIPSGKSESDPDKKLKLDSFRELVRRKMVKFYETPSELGSVVSRSIIRLIKDNPSYGWVKGDNISTDAAREEILKLKLKIDDLESQLESVSVIDPEIQANLSRGNDDLILKGVLTLGEPSSWQTTKWWHDVRVTWNELFAQISPLLIDEGSKQEIIRRVQDFLIEKDGNAMSSFAQEKGKNYRSFELSESSIDMCIVQFIALNYIEKGVKRRPIQDKNTYWRMTTLGEKAMYELRAIRRLAHPQLSTPESEMEPKLEMEADQQTAAHS